MTLEKLQRQAVRLFRFFPGKEVMRSRYKRQFSIRDSGSHGARHVYIRFGRSFTAPILSAHEY